MGNIRSVFLVFGFLSIVFFAPFEASAQQSCGDMATCAQGQNGPGGCYRPHRQDCYDGLICSKSMRLCSPGPNGPGGCYKLNYAQCFSGLICEPGMEPCNDAQGPRCVRIGSNLCNRPAQACPTGMHPCKPGPYGPGGCYKLNYAQCFDGLICEPGMQPCNDAQGPRCVRVGSNLCNRPAAVCPQGMRECPSGPNGPGGCYKLNYAQCLGGLICEPGMQVCNDALGPRCVRIGSNLCNRPTPVCPQGMRECKAGPNGPGGCYKLNYAYCSSGLICATGMKVCKDQQGTRCYKPGYGQCGTSPLQRPFSPSPFPTPSRQPTQTPTPGGGWNAIQ